MNLPISMIEIMGYLNTKNYRAKLIEIVELELGSITIDLFTYLYEIYIVLSLKTIHMFQELV